MHYSTLENPGSASKSDSLGLGEKLLYLLGPVEPRKNMAARW